MDENMYRILIVDDEEDIVEFVSYNLKREGFKVDVARNGREALQAAIMFCPHLILLDIMMPEMDGIETCEEIRAIPSLSDTLIAFLTARSEDYTQIAGFSAGADDFITKPVRPRVLTSHIKALLKRYHPTTDTPGRLSTTQNGDELVVDQEKHIVLYQGKELELPRKEFNLITLLTSKPFRVFTRDEIFNHLWGDDGYVNDRTIDVYIRKLREKIGTGRIKTIKGVGYRYEI